MANGTVHSKMKGLNLSVVLMGVLCTLMAMSSCSVQKNTAMTRFWHSFVARYNTVYNGKVAFKSGLEAQEKGHQDDYTELLPMYISTNKRTANNGKSNYETAITKCEKAIKLHSIKKKPANNSNSKLTPKEKAFRARHEFNPYLYRVWLLMGEAQFQKGDFIEAASTFGYIASLYQTQPEISSVAKAWLARCYVALEWPYDAEDILNKMQRDSISIAGQRAKDNTQAAFFIQTGRYAEAIPCLQRAVKYSKGKLNRARLNYLLGQLYHETGDNRMAYKYLSKVVRSNPPYELEFNARIMQTEVMSKDKFRQMIRKLQRMAKSERNKDYLDRVYYAIGNIYLSAQDTTHCIYAWEKGVEKATQSGVAKAVLLLRLGQVYWEKEKYIEAQKAYKDCLGILDKEHDDYKESERRSKILDELAPPLSDVKLQDSLQALAQMDEKDYLAAIDRVIEELKKKEKEEEKKAAANGQQPTANNQAARPNTATANTAAMAGPNRRGAWYFYNAQTVMSGKQEFQRRWGQRTNEDNWRRSNKQASTGNDFEEYDYDEKNDSLYGSGGGNEEDEDKAFNDSLANDPHHREYYLKQIPFTEDQMAASHATLSEGLYNAGVIEVEKLGNLPLALSTLLRLLNDYPDFEKKDDIYYHMFLLMGRMGNVEEAERYRKMLIEEYPETKIAILLANPNYEMISTMGKHIEDSVYMAAYEAYKEDRYDDVNRNFEYSTQNFPEGQHRGKLLFVHAMTQLYTDHRKEFLEELKEVVQKHSKDEVSEMAQYIVKGLEEGRLLSAEKFSTTGIWGRRTVGLGTDSTAINDTLSVDRYDKYNFVLAYPTGALKEEQLLYEMARYNFGNYMVRNFEIETMELEGISMLCIKGFLSYDEVHAYAQKLYGDARMNRLLEGIKTLLISDHNLQMLGKQYSFDDYGVFFEKKIAPLNVPDNLQIDTHEVPFLDPDDMEETTDGEEEEVVGGYVDDDDFPFGI